MILFPAIDLKDGQCVRLKLGEMDDAPNEIEDLQKKIEESGMPKEAREKDESEHNKLKMM